MRAHVQLQPDATPKFYKPRPVLFAVKEKIENDLECLTKMGVVEPILRSDLAAPIVPVMKAGGKTVRACGDFRLTLNPSIRADWHPLPPTKDLFAFLAGEARYF